MGVYNLVQTAGVARMKLFILDVPIIVILGFVFALIHKRVVDKHPTFLFYAGLLVTLLFWIPALLSALVSIDPWFGLIKCGLARQISRWLALFFVLSYPLFFIWGTHRAFGLFGYTPRQGGVLWLTTLEDKTKPFKPAWKETEKISD